MYCDKEQDLIALVLCRKKAYWFLTFKEMWVLNRKKWINEFISNGVKGVNPEDHEERYNLALVNEDNAEYFISKLIKDNYVLDKNDLSTEFYKRLESASDWWDIYDLMPDIYIDFDNKKMYSNHIEAIQLVNYLPVNWVAERKDFCQGEILPESEKFWISNNINYREKLISKS